MSENTSKFEDVKIVNSSLKVKASKELQKEIEAELKLADPELDNENDKARQL